MTVQETKETVVLAGKRLVESGLIARTWGNVSCRISNSHFVITPSGRDYLMLTPEEIVEVAINDCSYSGDIKPSSEKGVHAEVYKLHSEVNFVIHTHQDHASAVSVLPLESIKVSEDFPFLCGEVICAGYGLPGTKKLRQNVGKALALSKGNAVIMKNHGALCFGSSYEDAFQVAQQLETACERYVQDKCLTALRTTSVNPNKIGFLALLLLTKRTLYSVANNALLTLESERTKDGFRLHFHNETFEVSSDQFNNTLKTDQSVLLELQIHNKIYKSHSDINYILHSADSGIMAVSSCDMKLRPLLDDFAQIAGTSVKTVKMDVKAISAALKHSSTVLIQNSGALCCGSTKADSQAVSIVTEKNCNALICAALHGKVKYINRFECMLMRFVYLKKYSKQNNKK